MKNIEIKLKLTTKTHLVIGSGESQFIHSADIIQMRRKKDNIKRICIPASSFKGVLRSSAIQVAHFLGVDYCKTVDVDKMDKSCIICELFGASNKPSKIYCEDCYPTTKNEIKLKIFTQNRTERKTGKSKAGALFTKELIPPEVEFETNLIGKRLNEKNQEESLLLFALSNMNYCCFGNSGGLLEIEIKEIKNISKDKELIRNLLQKMGYHEEA